MGVEAKEIAGDQFDVRDRMGAFIDIDGDLQACGTCLKLHNSEESDHCPMLRVSGLLEVMTESDRVLTIG